MVINNQKKINVKRAILWLFFLITIIMNSGSAIILSNDDTPLIFLLLIGVYLIFVEGILKRKFLTKKVISNPLFILSIAIFINLIVNFDFVNYGGYFRQILVFVVSLLFVLTIDFKKFSKYFLKFIVFVTLFSIVIWILINIFGVVPPHLILRNNGMNENYNSYYNFIICFVNIYNPLRIMGPFWEPGVLASMILFALIFNENMDYGNTEKHKNFIILLLGLVLTMSTAGYILFLIFLIYKMTKSVHSKTTIILGFGIFFCIIFIFMFKDNILLKLSELFPDVFKKLVIDSMSKSTRINGPMVDLKIFGQSPIFGVGMSSYQKLWPVYAKELIVESRTSTITYFLANYGIAGILYFYTVVVSFMRLKNIKIISKIALIIIFICILTKEPHYVNLTTNIILLYFYCNNERSEVNEKLVL